MIQHFVTFDNLNWHSLLWLFRLSIDICIANNLFSMIGDIFVFRLSNSNSTILYQIMNIEISNSFYSMFICRPANHLITNQSFRTSSQAIQTMFPNNSPFFRLFCFLKIIDLQSIALLNNNFKRLCVGFSRLNVKINNVLEITIRV